MNGIDLVPFIGRLIASESFNAFAREESPDTPVVHVAAQDLARVIAELPRADACLRGAVIACDQLCHSYERFDRMPFRRAA